jgi:O-antigen polymerase
MCLPLLYQNNENSGLVLHRFLGLGGGFLLYLSFQQFHFNSKDRHWFLYIILAGILIQTFYGLAQHFFPLESWFGIIAPNPFGILMQKNIMATFLVTGAAISLFLLIKDDLIMQSNLKKRIVFLTPILTSILYIPLNSRAGYLSFTIAIGLLLMLGNKKIKQVRTWIGLVLIGLLIGASLPTLGTKSPYSIESALSKSTSARKLIYKLTFELWQLDPLTGIGYGKFFSSFRHYYAQRISEDTSIYADLGNVGHPHNETLFWMVEGGIVPLIGLLIIAGGFLIMIWRAKSPEAWATAGLIIPILIHTQVELPFYLSLIHWFLFIFLFYCIDEDFGEWHVKKMPWKIFPRVVAVIIPGIIIPYMVTALQTGFVITKFERTGLKDTSLLLSAWNPKSLHRKFDTQARRIHLNFAKKTKNNEVLQDFIQWAEKYVKHSPYPFIYYDLAIAYEAIGDREKAWEVYNTAKYLFPNVPWKENPEPGTE